MQELEKIIREKRMKLEMLEDLEKEHAVCLHLIGIDDFVEAANRRLNEIMHRHGFVIRTEQQHGILCVL